MIICLQAQHVGGSRAAGVFGYRFDADEVLIGRSEAVDVRLPDAKVSLVHARVFVRDKSLWIEDLSSTNGTRIDGRLLTAHEPERLTRGQTVAIGAFHVALVDEQVRVPATRPQDTASYARRMLVEVLEAVNGHGELIPYLEVSTGPTAGERTVLPTLGGALVIGRGEECDVRLVDEDASRRHAEVAVVPEGSTLRDLGSRNGIFLNDQRVDQSRILHHGDYLRLGNTVLRFVDPTEEALVDLGSEFPAASSDTDGDRRAQAGELVAPVQSGPLLSTAAAAEISSAESVRAVSQLSAESLRSPSHGRWMDALLVALAVTLISGATVLLVYLLR